MKMKLLVLTKGKKEATVIFNLYKRFTGKPQIVQPPRTETVLQGSTVTLYCSVVSNPPATVTWTYPLVKPFFKYFVIFL